ncbi:MAG: nucleoside hydrolase [Rhodospirillales bacterium]|nr:nucleoside hydrolase [Rhodospirillales bacterium]
MACPVLIDCDPGTDDALALLLALGSPALDVRAITVAGGNATLERTLANARAIVELSGRDVPVHAGADRPLLGHFTGEARVHGADGLAGIVLPPGPPAAPGLAADAIRAVLRAAAAPVTLIGLAPVTNFALALASEPALTSRIDRVVLMGGAWGEGNATPAAEFNALADPEALAILLNLGVRLTMAVLEVTSQVIVTPARLAGLGSGAGRALAAARAIQAAVPPSRRLGGAGTPLHDPCAVAYVIAPDLFHGRDAHLTVECGIGPGRGRTHIDRWGRTGRAANVHVLERVDAEGVFALLAESLARLP